MWNKYSLHEKIVSLNLDDFQVVLENYENLNKVIYKFLEKMQILFKNIYYYNQQFKVTGQNFSIIDEKVKILSYIVGIYTSMWYPFIKLFCIKRQIIWKLPGKKVATN